MADDRTEVEWNYELQDFFEAPFAFSSQDAKVTIEGGRVVAVFVPPQPDLEQNETERLSRHLRDIFRARQVQTRRRYELQGPRICHHIEGKSHFEMALGANVVTVAGGSLDFSVTDATGRVVRDSKVERIQAHNEALELVASKAPESRTLRAVLDSYSRSISDPDNELVHLYEVWEALKEHFSGERQAENALGISRQERRRLGQLANDEPLTQGRHRGKHRGSLRPAKTDELNEARRIVARWIEALARML